MAESRRCGSIESGIMKSRIPNLLDLDWSSYQPEDRPVPRELLRTDAQVNRARANRLRARDPVIRQKLSESAQKRSQNPEYRKKMIQAAQQREQNLRYQQNRSRGIQKRNQNPVWRENVRKANQKTAQDPKWQMSMRRAAKKRMKNSVWRQNVAQNNKITTQTGVWKQAHHEGIKRRQQDPQWHEANHQAQQKRRAQPQWRLQMQQWADSKLKTIVTPYGEFRGIKYAAKHIASKLGLTEGSTRNKIFRCLKNKTSGYHYK